jgi:hypothetical protein
VLTFHIYPGQ